MLRMSGHVSAGFYRCDVLFLQSNTMVFVILLQMRKVNFTALRGTQTRSSDENSVCPSVRQTRAL